MNALAQGIAHKAYALDSSGLDATLRSLDLPGWGTLVADLEFQPWDTGGGCMMLVAELPDGCQFGTTNGDAELPSNAETFWVGVMDPDGQEVYAAFMADGRLDVIESPAL
jgi:hypothetical protein